MKKAIVGLIFVLLSAGSVQAQTFKETFIEFKKFEAKTRSGITLNKYTDALASVDYATDAYRSEADDLNSENKVRFQKALDKYKSAANAWALYNAAKSGNVPEAFATYAPDYCPKTQYSFSGSSSFGTDNFDSCISEIWKDATEIIGTAKEVLPNQPTSKKIPDKERSKK